MPRILVTGAKGFIGSCLVRLMHHDHDVFGIVRQMPAQDPCPGVHWIEQDLTQPLNRSRFPNGIDAIIHLAQSRFYKQFPDGANDIFGVNIHGTFRLLEYARQAGAKCFIYASSGGVYGYSYERFAETDPVSPLNFYLSSKYSSELLIANYQTFFRTVVFRFFFVYGPGQQRMLIPTLIDRVISGKTIVVEGKCGLRINPTYVGDAIRVFEPALSLEKSDVFNVAGDETVTISELIGRIETVTGREAKVEHRENEPKGNLVADNTRIKEVLGVYPQVQLIEGLSRMI